MRSKLCFAVIKRNMGLVVREQIALTLSEQSGNMDFFNRQGILKGC